MSILTVAIGGVSPDPEVYVSLAAARNTIASRFGPTYTSWLALSDDQAGQTIVSATALIDAQVWDGDATGLSGGDPTTLQFPRTGLTRNGEAVDSTTVPPEVVQGVIELAVAIAAKPALVNAADQGSNVKSVSGGGGVGVTYFAPTTGSAPPLPVQVNRLVGRFLAMPTLNASDFGSGGGTVSQFSRCRRLDLTRPE